MSRADSAPPGPLTTMFQIPMRGNEEQVEAAFGRDSIMFQIPMRGNELYHVIDALLDKPVSNPHEG